MIEKNNYLEYFMIITDKTAVTELVNALAFCKKLKIPTTVFSNGFMRGYINSTLSFKMELSSEYIPADKMMVINNIDRFYTRLNNLLGAESFEMKLNINDVAIQSVEMNTSKYSMLTDCGSIALAKQIPMYMKQEIIHSIKLNKDSVDSFVKIAASYKSTAKDSFVLTIKDGKFTIKLTDDNKNSGVIDIKGILPE